MNRAAFYVARTLRNEAAIMSMSAQQRDLLKAVAGKSVALIGNARALAKSDFGTEIDASEMVVRINRAPMPSAGSHGTRTDWLAAAVRLRDSDRARIKPDRILWMSPKRKRLDWQSATSQGFYLHPLPDYHALRERLGAPPTTGAMLIDLLLRSDLSRLTLFGFDFFASLSLSGSRRADQLPHDFPAESAWVDDLRHRDARLAMAG